jgi:hypothetical protein
VADNETDPTWEELDKRMSTEVDKKRDPLAARAREVVERRLSERKVVENVFEDVRIHYGESFLAEGGIVFGRPGGPPHVLNPGSEPRHYRAVERPTGEGYEVGTYEYLVADDDGELTVAGNLRRKKARERISNRATFWTRVLLHFFGSRLNREVFYPAIHAMRQNSRLTDKQMYEVLAEFDPTQDGVVGLIVKRPLL